MIERIELPAPGIETLHAEACAEGHDFIQTLVEEWANGKNRFDGPGEALCGHFEDGVLVAVGGLNMDPFAGRPDVGRIRKVYVRAGWRNKGLGRALIVRLLAQARTYFHSVHLRAVNADAARLYEGVGFVRVESADFTHSMTFDEQPDEPFS